ncbi:sulfatase-like hydrolase/transferase [Paracoccus litorisediminis]|uniref:sulfatase-like hydrolase/transferase n=1 Tax=Paracoccus litorisediminis TaxID=2006130 RepID=UPI00372E8233
MPVKNILNISVDDCFSFRLMRDRFGVTIQTPNLDASMAKATIFDKAYCEIAVCSPSRYATMSGYSPFQTGHFNSEYMWHSGSLRPQDMWGYRLKQAGFYCRTGGKMFHGYGKQPDWVNEILYHQADGISFGESGPYNTYPGPNGGNLGYTDTALDHVFYDAKSAQAAINFINGWTSDQPFYCEAGFHHPHTGYNTPDRFKAQYDYDAPNPPGVWANGFSATDFAKVFLDAAGDDYDGTTGGLPAWNLATWRGSLCNYFSAISHMDHEVGRLLAALDASPHAANTMVCFWSDHGFHTGDQGKWEKFTMWESAALTPCFIYIPGQTPRVVTDPVSLMDISATVMDYAGLPAISGSPGTSLRPYIEGGTIPNRWIPTFWYGSCSATDGTKRIVMYQDASVETYDLTVDPFCTNNLGRSVPWFGSARDALLAACKQHGYKLAEQGMAMDTATEGAIAYMGFMGDVTSEKAQGSWASIAATNRGAESPGYRKQMVALTAGTGDLIMQPGTDRLHVQSPRGANYRILGHNGDKQIRLINLGGEADGVVEIALVAGNNYVYGEAHSMTVHGGTGNDTVEGGNKVDRIYGGAGDDSILAGGGNDVITGDGGNDFISGEGGSDTIDGGAGADTILGGDGQDRIIMFGGDYVTGGAGNDRFVVLKSERAQTIIDLTVGDIIDLSDWAGIQPVAVTQVGSAVHVTAGMEQLICNSATVATVSAAISGATIA